MNRSTLSVVIVSTILGIALPTIIYFTVNVGVEIDHFGSCLVNPEFRFKCGIDQEKDVLTSLQNCSNVALGCWEDLESLQFKCYHSIPAASQYYLKTPVIKDGNDEVTFNIRPGNKVNAYLIEMKSRISWHSKDVLSIQFAHTQSSFEFPEEEIPSEGSESSQNEGDKSKAKRFGLYSDDEVVDGRGQFNISYSENTDEFFYVSIGRIGTTTTETALYETIFDTRLSPIGFYETNMTFGTVLPTKFFYGIKGGQGVTELGATLVDGVTTFGQNELPFYMVREKSGRMHGMLLETTKPFVAQVIDGPGIMFYWEGITMKPFSIKFFVGPTSTDVLKQFSSYMMAKTKRSLYMPPYWGLGLHLCRRSKDHNETMIDLKNLKREDPDDPVKLPEIPYDSDCISENLRPFFKIDNGNFPSTELDKIINKITQENNRHVLPAQKLVFTNKAVASTESTEMFILSESMSSRFQGYKRTGEAVNFLSVFNKEAKTWIETQFKSEPKFQNPFDFKGVALVDNLPRHENASWIRIQEDDMNSRIKSNFSTKYWGTVSPQAMHANVDGAVGDLTNQPHLELANGYGHESFKLFEKIAKDYKATERMVVSTSSMWTESFLYGAFSGVEVPFTWGGLRDSLSNLLRYFMFTPYGGTPICGSMVVELNKDNTTNQDLCLRWFQVALLLPFARNAYGETNKNISRGPLDLNPGYQKHLIRNIRERYAYNPYYYTLFKDYTTTGIPPVVPLSFYFNDNDKLVADTFPILDQFMIGTSLMAAPLVFPGTSRPVYFPPGLWYNMEGELAWDDISSGGIATVSALINYVPVFLRDEHILPILNNPIGNTAVESRAGNYTLIGTYPRKEYRTNLSKGRLYLDDGVSANVGSGQSDIINFELSETHFAITADSCHMNLATNKVSTFVDEIRIFGFPKKPKHVTCSIKDYVMENSMVIYDAEMSILRFKLRDIDWCEDTVGPKITISWESPY